MTQYEGFRTAQIELEKEQKRLEAEYSTMAQQLDSLYKSYEQQRLLMSEDRKKEKENELIVNPLLCELATATPVANEPNAFFKSSVLN